MSKFFVLYDGRARTTGDTDRAVVLDTAESEAEIAELYKKYPGLYPRDALWYEYEVRGSDLVNGKSRYDLDWK